MGDLTQSLYLLDDLVEAERQRVSVLVDKRLETFLRARVPSLEAVYTLDLERTLRGFREGRPWTGLWTDLAEELRPLSTRGFERIINLNFGRLPVTVTETIRGKAHVQGFRDGLDGSFGDPWVDLVSRLLQSDRRWNRIHLVDFFRLHSRRRIPSALLGAKERAPLSERSVLGIQVATRCEKRTWGVESFIEVIRRLRDEVGCEVILFGEERERPLAERIVRLTGSPRLHDLVGKTSLEDLLEMLGACDRLLSADTGTLHLAARRGVPCLALFFGPAYLFETGPYGHGHVVLQATPSCGPCREDDSCDGQDCRRAVRPDTVVRLLKDEPVEPCSGIRLFASDFSEEWLWYRPLTRKEAGREDIIGFLYRACAGEYLGKADGSMPSPAGTLRLFLDHYRVDRSLLMEVGENLGSAVPDTLPVPDRLRLQDVLQRGWAELREMRDALTGKEPFRVEAAAA